MKGRFQRDRARGGDKELALFKKGACRAFDHLNIEWSRYPLDDVIDQFRIDGIRAGYQEPGRGTILLNFLGGGDHHREERCYLFFS